MNKRQELRKLVKSKRLALTAEQHKLFNYKIAQHIINSDLFKNSQHIACYVAKGTEVSLQKVVDAILSAGKHCYLPLIRQGNPELYFIEYLANDDLQIGSFEILEPKFDEQKLIAPKDLDLVLAPLVAFDVNGNRLGQGGGYYDRTFRFVNHPPLIGIAYACQEVSQIAAQPWDVKLHGVVTEESFKIF